MEPAKQVLAQIPKKRRAGFGDFSVDSLGRLWAMKKERARETRTGRKSFPKFPKRTERVDGLR